MFRVYHAKPPGDGMFGMFGIGDPPDWPEDYEEVAIASAATTLDEAFVLTNSVDRPWYQGVFVQPRDDERRYRSTSVWDVIVDTKENTVYRVENSGFTKLGEWKQIS